MIKLLDFYAPWCKPCERMEPLLLEVFGKNSEKIQKINIDTDEGLALATNYRVRSVPTLIMVTTNGDALSMRIGPQTIAQLNAWKDSYEGEEFPGDWFSSYPEEEYFAPGGYKREQGFRKSNN
jgi:thioredoxin-like negative regulator of GroEL